LRISPHNSKKYYFYGIKENLMKTKKIQRKISRINKEIGDTPVCHDGRYQQLIREKELLELSFYKETK